MAKKPFTRIMEGLGVLRKGLSGVQGEISRLTASVDELRRRDREHPLTICFKHIEPWSCRADLRYDPKSAEEYRREMIAREITEALLKHGLVQIAEKPEEMGMTYAVELRLWGVDPRITARFCNHRGRVEMRSFGGGCDGWV